MMMAFRVMLNGRNITMHINGRDTVFGFVKNEYVWAYSECDAVIKAKRNVSAEIKIKLAAKAINSGQLTLDVEEIERGVAPWKLFSYESFIFFEQP